MDLAQSKTRIFLFGGVAAVFLIFILLIVFGSKPVPPRVEPVSLTFWGVHDDSDIYDSAIKAFKAARSQVSITYKKITPQEYDKAIIEGLASGKGPDIIMLHNTGLFKNKEILTPMPPCMTYNEFYRKYMAPSDDTIPPLPRNTPRQNCEYTNSSFKQELYKNILKNYGKNFVPVAAADFISDGKIYAMPLYVDTLALFYNKEHFYSSAIPEPPATWDEFISVVQKLRRIRPDGSIERAAAALGDTNTVHRAADIFMLLALQSGASPIDLTKRRVSFTESRVLSDGRTVHPTMDALKFYLAFSNPKAFIGNGNQDVYTWSGRQNYSIDAFSRGNELSMILDYAYVIGDIKRKNAYLNFGIAPVPQLEKDSNKKINYADYYGVAVTNKVLDKTKQGSLICGSRCGAAWEFLIFLTNTSNSKNYLDLSKRPTARIDLVNFQGNDPELGVFAVQSLTAKSWARPDKLLVEQILLDTMNNVLKENQDVFEALRAAEERVKVLIPPYKR